MTARWTTASYKKNTNWSRKGVVQGTGHWGRASTRKAKRLGAMGDWQRETRHQGGTTPWEGFGRALAGRWRCGRAPGRKRIRACTGAGEQARRATQGGAKAELGGHGSFVAGKKLDQPWRAGRGWSPGQGEAGGARKRGSWARLPGSRGARRGRGDGRRMGDGSSKPSSTTRVRQTEVECYSKPRISVYFLASRLAHNHLPGIVIYLPISTACNSFIKR
jgi:hypothetical protein